MKNFCNYNGKLLVSRAKKGDKAELLNLIDDNFKDRHGGYTKDFLTQALSNWPDLSINNFLIVKNKNGQIVSACALWKPSSAKRTIVTRLSLPLKLLKLFLKIFKPFPTEGEELKIAYLSFMATKANKHEALKALLSYIRKTKATNDCHILGLQVSNLNDSKGLRSISTKTKINLYELTSKKEPQPISNIKLGFDISLT